MADNSILTGSESNDFFVTIQNAIDKLKELDNVTSSAKANIQSYAKSFNSLNKELKNFASAGSKMKSTNGGSSSSSGSSSNANKNNSNAEQEVEKITDSIQKSAIDSFSNIFSAISNLGGGSKGFGSVLKNSSKLVSGAVKTTSKLNGVMGAAVSTGTKVAGILGLIVSALIAMGEAGKAAYDRNIDINRSLMQMGANSSELKDASTETANQTKNMKHQWTLIGQQIQDFFQPVYEFFVNIASMFTDAVYDLTGAGVNDKYNSANVGSRARWYTAGLEKNYYEPESTSIPVINNIAGTARQSGFDLSSAVNLGIGTYDAAFKLAQKYGLEAADIAEQLASAWQSGSDAAKEYGVVVNDTVLSGYLADKGIDIVNVQISDAMKEYYRYQLMQEELGASNQDVLQKQIKSWTQLGMEIEATKNKLFSFDEVINLQAVDTTIPTVGKPTVGPYETVDEGNGGGITPIITKPFDWGTPPKPDPYDWGTPPKVDPFNWGVVPQVNVNWGVIPNLDINWGQIPNLDIGWGEVPNLIIDWGQIPNLNINWGQIPNLNINWGQIPNLAIDWQANWGVVRTWSYELIRALQQHPEWVQQFTNAVNQFNEMMMQIASFFNGLVGTVKNVLSVFGIGKKESTAAVEQNKPQTDWNALIQAVQKLPNTIINEAVGGDLRIGDRMYEIYDALMGHTLDRDTFMNTYNSWAQPIAEKIDAAGEKARQIPINEIGQAVGVAGATVLGAVGVPAIAPAVGTAATTIASKVGGAASSAASTIGNKIGEIKNTVSAGLSSLSGKLDAIKIAAQSSASSNISSFEYYANNAAGKIVQFASNPASPYSFRNMKAAGFASGGIGTHEINNATLFENNKKEAVIPLESQAGIDYLANAMRSAQGDNSLDGGSSITINLSLNGIFDTDDRGKWDQLAEKLAETIQVQAHRRGDLAYGSSY